MMIVITVVLFVEDLTGGLKKTTWDGMKKILSAKDVKMVLKALSEVNVFLKTHWILLLVLGHVKNLMILMYQTVKCAETRDVSVLNGTSVSRVNQDFS